MGTVPVASLVGMCVSLVIAFGLPIGLMIYGRVKLKANWIWVVIGAVTFVIFALVLEQILHIVMLRRLGNVFAGNVLLKAVYGGLAAGIFEEVGRFVSMNLFKKHSLGKQNAFMYGVGHGGIEAIILVGITYILNLLTSFMINAGTFEASLSMLDDKMKEDTLNQVSLLWTLHPTVFFMAGVERIIAIALHICLSYIVYRAVVDSKIQLLLLSIAIHAGIDFITVLLGAQISVFMLEIILLLIVAIISIIVYKKYKGEENNKGEQDYERESL